MKFDLHKPDLIYLARNPSVPATSDTEEEDIVRAEEEERKDRVKRERRQNTEGEVARLDVDPETRARMRECLASGSLERQNILERYLNEAAGAGREFNERGFKKELEMLDKEDESWKKIFEGQREVRKRIQDLQYRAESYIEFIPTQKQKFDSLIKQARSVNRQDDITDRGLKRTLAELTKPNERTNAKAILNAEQAREIWLANPTSPGYESTLKKYKSTIEAAPGGGAVFRRIMAFKKEEARTEREFWRLTRQLDQIVRDNLDKVRRKAERERALDIASRSTGITIKEGIELEFNDPELLDLGERKKTIKISRIIFDQVETRDHTGKVINVRDGVPHMHLSNGAQMPLGRFKKWVDATDAVERISSLSDVEEATHLKRYGIKIKPGMELSYPVRSRDRQGKIITTPAYVRITEIKNNQIFFSEPVLFNPGFSDYSEYEYRNSLSFGEFVKWWHRYEVEKSLSFAELQQLLLIHNEFYNKQFGIEQQENPPILLDKGEELKYPDGSGLTFRIQDVDQNITLTNGEKFTYSEFFNWIKVNNVERASGTSEKQEELEEKEKHKREIEFAKGETEHDKEKNIIQGMERYKTVENYEKSQSSGTLLGKLKSMWFETQFLSLNDLWNMTKEIVEFVKRKHERRSKGRYGEVGSRLPWVLGTEFERVKQSAETEEVNKYKEAMEHWSIEKVKRTLHETNSRDEAKSCIMTLVHKGEMRWDDHEFWNTLNRLTMRYTLNGAKLHIPDPDKIPSGKSGEDMAGPAMDALWGEGTATEWFQENISKYNSAKNNFEFKFKQLENDPKGTGGPAGECERLMNVWLDGGYVNPQDYEEMIDGAIKFGKMSAEDKMFYILAGVLARQGNRNGANPHGETLLHMDRIGELDSKYLNQFPMLDFFTQERVMDYTIYDANKDNGVGKPKGGWGKSRKLILSDFVKWMHEYFPNDFKRCKPGAEFARFMWEVMLMSENTRTRISKGIRNAENMDHDDAHLYIPPTTPSEIDSLCTGPSGQKKYFTNSGYANAYPGFTHYVLSLSHSIEEETDEEKLENKVIALRDVLNGFIRYDAILDYRFHKKEGDRYARLDDRHYRRRTVVDDWIMGKHQQQLRNLVVDIGREYGHDWSWLYGDKTGTMLDKKEEEKQTEYERKLDNLKIIIPQLFEQDKGAKAMEVIKRARERGEDAHGLRGIKSSKRPPANEIAALKANAKHAAAEAAHEGHGH